MLAGVDPHADQVTVTVTTDDGRAVESWQVPNTQAGWRRATGRVPSGTRWLIENAHGWGYGLARYLAGSGTLVSDVPPWMTAQLRSRQAHPAKTDPADARLIALAGIVYDPPVFMTYPTIDELRALVSSRQLLVKMTTQTINHLKATLRTINPTHPILTTRIRTRTQWVELCHLHTPNPTITTSIHTLANTGLTLTTHINTLTTRIHDLLPPAGHALMNIPGIGLISAATILTEVRHPHRFPTHATMASWAGIAPLEISSGRHHTHRLNRWGNRTIATIIYRAIETQAAHNGPAATYLTRRQQQGTPRPTAKRACARHLTRTIHKTLTNNPWT